MPAPERHTRQRAAIRRALETEARPLSPAELLAETASAFVADFLGEERGLKRLALMHVRDISPGEGPVVDVGASGDHARDVMARHRVDWIGVRDGPTTTRTPWLRMRSATCCSR